MARTAIPITAIAAYQVGTSISSTVSGDAANDHSLDLTYAPKLMLIVTQFSANSVDFTIELPATKQTYEDAKSVSHTITSGQVMIIPIDLSTDLAQTGNVLHIDSADPNFSDLSFAAYTWTPTPGRAT